MDGWLVDILSFFRSFISTLIIYFSFIIILGLVGLHR